MMPPSALKQRVLDAAQSTSARPRKSPLRRMLGSALAILLMMTTVALAKHEDPVMGSHGTFAFVGALAIAIVASRLALARPRSMLGFPRVVVLMAIVLTPLALGAWLMLGPTDTFGRLGVRCFLLTLATAPWPFWALLSWSKRLDPVSPTLTGAALGSAAGAWAGAMITLFCPLSDPGHVLRGHVLPFVVIIAAGALVGAWSFRLKRIGR